MTDINVLDEYQHDIHKLKKKYDSIEIDVDRFLKVLLTTLPEHLSGTVRISNLGITTDIPIYKAQHFHCASLKGKGSRSGIRLIYCYLELIEELTLIEIYCKTQQENETKKRIINFIKSKQKN
jgi:hypothetical protein